MTPLRYKTARISVATSVGANQSVDTIINTDSSDERVVGLAIVDATTAGDLPFRLSFSNDAGTFVDPVSKNLLEFSSAVPQTMQPLENQPVSSRFLPVDEKAEGMPLTLRVTTPASFTQNIVFDVIVVCTRKPRN